MYKVLTFTKVTVHGHSEAVTSPDVLFIMYSHEYAN